MTKKKNSKTPTPAVAEKFKPRRPAADMPPVTLTVRLVDASKKAAFLALVAEIDPDVVPVQVGKDDKVDVNRLTWTVTVPGNLEAKFLSQLNLKSFVNYAQRAPERKPA